MTVIDSISRLDPGVLLAVERMRSIMTLAPVDAPRWNQIVEARPPVGEALLDEMREAQIFIAAYDFHAAFQAEEGFGGSYTLPYDNFVFEFRVALGGGAPGHYVMWFLVTEEKMLNVFLFGKIPGDDRFRAFGLFRAQQDGKWRMLDVSSHDQAQKAVSLALFDYMQERVAGALLALGAEVAVVEVERRPSALQSARARRGKTPLPDFRVVTLPQSARTAGGENSGSERRVRAHWRRRHEHRYWVAGELVTKVVGPFRVGDGDLGWVHKYYRVGGARWAE